VAGRAALNANLDADLLTAARERAKAEGITLTALLDRALRRELKLEAQGTLTLEARVRALEQTVGRQQQMLSELLDALSSEAEASPAAGQPSRV
jgi:hypothetical protein